MFSIKSVLTYAGLVAGLSACSHMPPIQEYTATANPTDEIQKLDADMTTADRNQVEILSPANYENARVSLKDAKSDLADQKDNAKTLHEVAKGRAYLTQALAVAQTAHSNVDDVITARGQAIAAGAPTHFDKEFATIDRNFREVTRDAEKGDSDELMKNRSKLQKEYLDLELVSIKADNLNKAKDTIKQAQGENAKKYAPRTLAIALKSYEDTDAYITANRHDPEVATKSAETLTKAQHLLKITRSAKSDKKTSPEELALQMEQEQGKVIQEQSEVQKRDSELANKESELQGKDAQLNGAALALQKSNSKAQAEKDFNAKYATARAEFSDSEAEVYKQGDDLVIRLKTLDFPTSKAVLKAANFSLLAKVQKVIKDFGDSSVVVEGHTDSVGGKVANEKLSTARAEAVREYFVANEVVPAEKITAVGYDFQKPLASNKTASGRAQNRRVDIRIQPEKTTSL